MKTPEQLLERALVLICVEWGHTREEALAWLNNDDEDWTPRETPPSTPMPGAFIQVTRQSFITPCSKPSLNPSATRSQA